MNYYSTRNGQNMNAQIMLYDLFEESISEESNSELGDVLYGEDETYGGAIPTTFEMNPEEDEHADHSSSTHTSDLSDCDEEEFDFNPLPCNGSEQLAPDYLSMEGSLDIFRQDNCSGAVSPGSESTGSSVTPNNSSSTHTSDLSDYDEEEFDFNPLPCNGSEQLADYLSGEGGLNIFHQDNCPRAVSPGSESTRSSVTPNNMMEKLAECMERSALSRSLVETFCQSSLETSVSQENIQVSSTMAMKKSGECIQQDNKIHVKASVSHSTNTKKYKIGSFLRSKSKNKKQSDSVSSLRKKNDNFRASGLKLSTKVLIAKFNILKRGGGNQDNNGNHIIASFLRMEKLKSKVLQKNLQAA
jgi:hypothetical protein